MVRPSIPCLGRLAISVVDETSAPHVVSETTEHGYTSYVQCECQIEYLTPAPDLQEKVQKDFQIQVQRAWALFQSSLVLSVRFLYFSSSRVSVSRLEGY